MGTSKALKISDMNMITGKRKILQNQFLNALMTNDYKINDTCNKIGITKTAYYTWLKVDPEFKKAMDIMRNQEIDNIEDAFRDLIVERNPQAVIFGLKTRGAHRGYQEKQQIEHFGNAGFQIHFHEGKDDPIPVDAEIEKIDDKEEALRKCQ